MALDIGGKGKIGCAYYVAGEERLFCMEEVVLGGVDIIEKCEGVPICHLLR